MLTKQDSSRALTASEIRIATCIFKNAVNYAQVRIYKGSYFPFNLQNQETAVTPNGNMYWPARIFKENFAYENIAYQNWFMHEFTHVWQYQMGMNVRARGLLSGLVNYKYSLPKEKTLADFSMEQQACIVSDYFTLTSAGYNGWKDVTRFQGIHGPDLMQKYRNTLHYFLVSPADRRSLWK